MSSDSLTRWKTDNPSKMYNRFRDWHPIFDRVSNCAWLTYTGFEELEIWMWEICQQGFSTVQEIIHHCYRIPKPQQVSA
jgi:hypothetical protein